MLYQNFRKGLRSFPKLILYKPETNGIYLKDKEADYYVSLYQYTEEHKKIIEEKKTVSGITDTSTDKLYFDFDSKDNLELAKQDAITLAHRLIDDMRIEQESIRFYFSGNKGFTVELWIDKRLSPKEFKDIIYRLGSDLQTCDLTVSDPNRIVRVSNTKHQTSGLYKIPLKVEELDEWSIEQIKEIAKKPRDLKLNRIKAKLNVDLLPEAKVKERKITHTNNLELNWDEKPKNWRNCKWALSQGLFDEGERDTALMILAATYRALGLDKDATYNACDAAVEKQAERTGGEKYSKEELWRHVIEGSVFKDTWQGGQYSCKKDIWLKKYCASLSEHQCSQDEQEEDHLDCISLNQMTNEFIQYAKEFQFNIIKTGLKELDDNVHLMVSSLVGLLGQPGCGKTSLSLNYLIHTSLNNIPSLMLSLDMSLPLIYGKLIQKLSRYTFANAMELFKNPIKEKERDKLIQLIHENYSNIGFNFKPGLTIPEIKKVVMKREQNTGKKVKLLVVDYLECVAGLHHDPMLNAGMISTQLMNLAKEMSLCVLLLLQTQKHATPDISDPLLSLRQIKGSSLIEQNCSVILTLWREGYNPSTIEDDNYASIAVVKNRFGPLWRGDFKWTGITGNIDSLNDQEKLEFEELKEKKREERLRKLQLLEVDSKIKKASINKAEWET